MLAHLANKANIGPHGIPMDVATDPKNQFAFQVPAVRRDHAARTLGDAQDAYYRRNYTDKNKPINNHGDLWSVELKKP